MKRLLVMLCVVLVGGLIMGIGVPALAAIPDEYAEVAYQMCTCSGTCSGEGPCECDEWCIPAGMCGGYTCTPCSSMKGRYCSCIGKYGPCLVVTPEPRPEPQPRLVEFDATISIAADEACLWWVGGDNKMNRTNICRKVLEVGDGNQFHVSFFVNAAIVGDLVVGFQNADGSFVGWVPTPGAELIPAAQAP